VDILNSQLFTALLGALLGALGAYAATVYSARQTGQRRVYGLLRAIRIQVREARADRGQVLPNLERNLTACNFLLQVLGQAHNNSSSQSVVVEGQTVDLQDADTLERLLAGVMGVNMSFNAVGNWLPALTQDIEHLPSELYIALTELEKINTMLEGWSTHIYQPMTDISNLMMEYTLAERTTRAFAERDAQNRAAFRACLRRYVINLDIFRQLQIALDQTLEKVNTALEQVRL
jgi:hypothetical protein